MISTSGAISVYRSMSPPTAEDRHGANPPAVSSATRRTDMGNLSSNEAGAAGELVCAPCFSLVTGGPRDDVGSRPAAPVAAAQQALTATQDRKSTRLNSSHVAISYA